jgi:hypothetical protein
MEGGNFEDCKYRKNISDKELLKITEAVIRAMKNLVTPVLKI